MRFLHPKIPLSLEQLILSVLAKIRGSASVMFLRVKKRALVARAEESTTFEFAHSLFAHQSSAGTQHAAAHGGLWAAGDPALLIIAPHAVFKRDAKAAHKISKIKKK